MKKCIICKRNTVGEERDVCEECIDDQLEETEEEEEYGSDD